MQNSVIKVLVIVLFLVLLFGACFCAYTVFTREPVQNNPASVNTVSVNTPAPTENAVAQLDLHSQLFIEENFPKMDASLATQPLTDAFYENFVGINPGESNYEYTNTHWGYERLITGHTTFKEKEYADRDIIVVTYPSAEEQQLAADNNISLKRQQIKLETKERHNKTSWNSISPSASVGANISKPSRMTKEI